MKKMRLELDTLEVQSFATSAEAGRRGTVRGREYKVTYNCTMFGECEDTGYSICRCSDLGDCVESEFSLCGCNWSYSVEVNCDSRPTNCPCTP